MVAADRPLAWGPRSAARASEKSPVLMPLRYSQGDQLVQAPGPTQVGGQDGRGELLPLLWGPSVVNPGLLDLDLADAGLDGPLGEVAVADDLPPPGVILEVGVGVDPGGDLGLDGPGEHPAGPVAEDLGEDVLAGGQGHDADVGGRLVHGGVLLGLVGHMVCS
jgi:hypothetical protein